MKIKTGDTVIAAGDVISLSEAAKIAKVTRQSCVFWTVSGRKGRKLRTFTLMGKPHTTKQWLAEFINKTSQPEDSPVTRMAKDALASDKLSAVDRKTLKNILSRLLGEEE